MEDRFEVLVDGMPAEITESIEEDNGTVRYGLTYKGKTVNASWDKEVAQDMMAINNIDIAVQIKETLLREVKAQVLLDRHNTTYEKMVNDPARYSDLIRKYSEIVGVKE